jgi:hypothetical protein
MISTPVTAEFVRGAVELETTADGVLPHRLPAWTRTRGLDAQLAMVETEPSGVRLAFRTTATSITLRARRTQRLYAGLPARPDGRYDLVIDGEPTASATVGGGRVLSMDMTTGETTLTEGPSGTIRFDGLTDEAKEVELWLPHNETTELIELRTDAAVKPSTVVQPGWVHHGSSISQGSNASGPTAIWPAIAARVGGLALTNLGFGGGALLDPFVARTIRDLPADLITLELGINVVNTDLLRRRALAPAVHGFLDTIRDGHPTTPIIVVSPFLCPIHEATPGPGSFDLSALAEGRLAYTATGDPADAAKGKLTLELVRQDLATIVAQRTPTDPNLTILDGLTLYGPQDEQRHPLPDALHPDTETHRLIGVRFANQVFHTS